MLYLFDEHDVVSVVRISSSIRLDVTAIEDVPDG
jgi:hypothetical protein